MPAPPNINDNFFSKVDSAKKPPYTQSNVLLHRCTNTPCSLVVRRSRKPRAADQRAITRTSSPSDSAACSGLHQSPFPERIWRDAACAQLVQLCLRVRLSMFCVLIQSVVMRNVTSGQVSTVTYMQAGLAERNLPEGDRLARGLARPHINKASSRGVIDSQAIQCSQVCYQLRSSLGRRVVMRWLAAEPHRLMIAPHSFSLRLLR